MTTPRPARRTDDIAPFFVMEILARAQALEAQGRDIVHMEVGEPDFPTPEPIVQAAQAALAGGHTRYTPAVGLPALRRAIADYYGRRFGVAVAPGRIVVTPGSSVALQLVMAVLVDPGDEVLLCDPGYPCNRHLVRMVEGRTVALPVGPDNGFRPTPAQVDAAWTDRTRALLVASPSNPTGTVIGPDALRDLHRVVRAKGGCLIVDEIYQELAYESAPHTALALEADDVFVVNSFSKYFGMTGWLSAGWSRRRPSSARSTAWRRTSTSRRRPWRSTRPSRPSRRRPSQSSKRAAAPSANAATGWRRRLSGWVSASPRDRKERSTSTPTARRSRTTASSWPAACWRRRVSPSRPVRISA